MTPGKLYHRSIEVQPSDNNGWIVRIGCHQLVYGSESAVIIKDLAEFFEDPEEFENKFRKKHRSVTEKYPEEVVGEDNAPERSQ